MIADFSGETVLTQAVEVPWGWTAEKTFEEHLGGRTNRTHVCLDLGDEDKGGIKDACSYPP